MKDDNEDEEELQKIASPVKRLLSDNLFVICDVNTTQLAASAAAASGKGGERRRLEETRKSAGVQCEQETGRMLLKAFRASLGVIKTAAAAMPGNGRGKYLKMATVSRPVGRW